MEVLETQQAAFSAPRLDDVTSRLMALRNSVSTQNF